MNDLTAMYPTRIAALFLSIAIVLVTAGCGPTATEAPTVASAAYDPRAPLPSESIYALDAEWTSDAGSTLRLADLRGRPVVLAMVYAHCAYACPVIVHDIKTLAGAHPENGDVRFVLVSLDPERDTVEQLRRFRDGFGLDDRWTLLRGDAREVRRLAALLGVRYRSEADGQISHSNLITLLDLDGRVAARQEGLGAESADVSRALGRLSAAH